MSAANKMVLHSVPRTEWADAPDPYRPASMDAEGFIHLSTRAQIAWVANQMFSDRDDMVLLVVDPTLLPEPLVWEDCYDTGQEFPHLYAGLPHDAVTAVIAYPPDATGTYQTPEI